MWQAEPTSASEREREVGGGSEAATLISAKSADTEGTHRHRTGRIFLDDYQYIFLSMVVYGN